MRFVPWQACSASCCNGIAAASDAAARSVPVTDASAWPDWSITTRLDTWMQWPIVWRAVQCHRTQNAIYANLASLSDAEHEAIWGSQAYYRVFSTVNGGRALETDLFTGVRDSAPQ